MKFITISSLALAIVACSPPSFAQTKTKLSISGEDVINGQSIQLQTNYLGDLGFGLEVAALGGNEFQAITVGIEKDFVVPLPKTTFGVLAGVGAGRSTDDVGVVSYVGGRLAYNFTDNFDVGVEWRKYMGDVERAGRRMEKDVTLASLRYGF